MLDQSQTHLLSEGARRLGIELSHEHLERFSVYLEEIARWSRVANLVSQTEAEAIIRKHLLDSLAISPLIPTDGRLLDLGSGAGFPGLALAIIAAARSVTLLEARRKRVSFLKEVVRKTKTANVGVYEGRAETLSKEESWRGSFSVVVTRATWSFKDFLRIASPVVAEGGLALAMKGPQGEKELVGLEDSFLKKFGFFLHKKHEYVLPFGTEKRQAVIFAKKCST